MQENGEIWLACSCTQLMKMSTKGYNASQEIDYMACLSKHWLFIAWGTEANDSEYLGLQNAPLNLNPMTWPTGGQRTGRVLSRKLISNPGPASTNSSYAVSIQ